MAETDQQLCAFEKDPKERIVCVGAKPRTLPSSSVKPPLAARLCVCEREPPAHFAYLDPERIASEALQAFRLSIGTGQIAPSVQHSCRLWRSWSLG